MTTSWFSWISANSAKPAVPKPVVTGWPPRVSRAPSAAGRRVSSGLSHWKLRPPMQERQWPQLWISEPTT